MYKWVAILGFLLIGCGTGHAQYQHETRQVLMSGKRVIQVGDSVSVDVRFACSSGGKTRKYLRVVGGGQMPGSF